MQDKDKKIAKKPKRDSKGRYLPGQQGGHTGSKPWIYDDSSLEMDAQSLRDWVDENVSNKKDFLLKDWCFYNNIPPNHLAEFAKRNKSFREAVEYAKEWQAHMICKGALFKKLDPSFAKFMLTCVHHWKDNANEEDAKKALASDFAKFNENMEVLRSQQRNEENITKRFRGRE